MMLQRERIVLAGTNSPKIGSERYKRELLKKTRQISEDMVSGSSHRTVHYFTRKIDCRVDFKTAGKGNNHQTS